MRAAEAEAAGQGVLSIDDTILAKPHRAESALVGWHFDHTVNRAVKGLNLLTLFWQGASARLPVGDALVHKRAAAPGERPKPVVDKHPLFRDLARPARANARSFRAGLADRWFAREANLEWVHRELKTPFVFALKGNRLAVRREQNRRTTPWKRSGELALEEDQAVLRRGKVPGPRWARPAQPCRAGPARFPASGEVLLSCWHPLV